MERNIKSKTIVGRDDLKSGFIRHLPKVMKYSFFPFLNDERKKSLDAKKRNKVKFL
jgi:hypothetical protein